MNSRPSISRFELCLLLGASAALWWGCAAAGGVQRGTAPAHPAQPPPPAPGTRLELSYGNASTRARIDIDLSNTDIDLQMSSRPARDTARTAAPPTPLQAAPLPGTAPAASAHQTATRAEQAPVPAADTNTTAVVTGIRLAQDLFYRKQYPEALAAVQRTIDRKPTAEALALAGSIHYVIGDRQRAGTSWREALRLNPDIPGAAQMLARLDEEGQDAVRRPAAPTPPGGRP